MILKFLQVISFFVSGYLITSGCAQTESDFLLWERIFEASCTMNSPIIRLP